MRWLAKIDPWTAIELAGASLLGGGVWMEWGPQWACIVWGVLLLSVATLRGAMGMYLTRRDRP